MGAAIPQDTERILELTSSLAIVTAALAAWRPGSPLAGRQKPAPESTNPQRDIVGAWAYTWAPGPAQVNLHPWCHQGIADGPGQPVPIPPKP